MRVDQQYASHVLAREFVVGVKVLHVVLSVNPFQIGGTIVVRISILVIHLLQVFRIRNKC